MLTTDYAKFGNGILKEGEDESVRIWIEICNENEGRKVLPFESMITADAYIWSKFRDDKKLMEKLEIITNNNFDKKRGYYGEIGKNTVIKNCIIVKDVKVGEHAYIKGANKLKNLTILSSLEEPSQIGEGVELVNGIIGYGSKIFYGSKAVRFIIGRNTQLKYGARLINSILGDNSTVSCCEILNNLIFPFHEQHHNTSFLIATTIMGQSNIAAGATIGSNHNSRSPDGEIVANRGFWPGLCTNFKHNSKFASFVLISKGTYQKEMNILYPFCLVSIDNIDNELNIIPAYWFLYNMYAIARNFSKFMARDKREIKVQNIEFDPLAPDTISEILFIIERIEYLIGIYILNKQKDNSIDRDLVIKKGKEGLLNKDLNDIVLLDDGIVNKGKAKILKPVDAVKSYKEMCLYFIFKTIFSYFNINEEDNINDIIKGINNLYKKKLFIDWWNIGGQIIPEEELECLKNDIKNDKIKTWETIHERYKALWEKYPEQKARYSLYALEKIKEKEIDSFSKEDWILFFKESSEIVNKIYELSYTSREKDYTNPFRRITYNNEKEISFLNNLKIETDNYIKIINKLIKPE